MLRLNNPHRLETVTCPKCDVEGHVGQGRLFAPAMIICSAVAVGLAILGFSILIGIVKGNVGGAILILAMCAGMAFLAMRFRTHEFKEGRCGTCGGTIKAELRKGASGKYEWFTTLVEVPTAKRDDQNSKHDDQNLKKFADNLQMISAIAGILGALMMFGGFIGGIVTYIAEGPSGKLERYDLSVGDLIALGFVGTFLSAIAYFFEWLANSIKK